jgi:hypothetical protein
MICGRFHGMATLYAHIPDQLHSAIESYSKDRHVKLTAAAVELLEIGLDAVANATTNAALEERLAAATEQAAESRALAEQAENARAALQATLNGQIEAYALVGGRLSQPIGLCPSCKEPISGRDLVVSNACGKCTASLSALLDPKTPANSTLNGTEYLLLIGALGLLVGMAMAQSKKS